MTKNNDTTIHFVFFQSICENEKASFRSTQPTSKSSLTIQRHGNVTDLECLPSMGIRAANLNKRSPRLVSESKFQATPIFKEFEEEGRGISFVLWIKPTVPGWNVTEENGNDAMSLLAIGKRRGEAEGKRKNGITPCDEYGFDFHVVQQENYLEVYFRTSETVFEPCHRLRVQNVPFDGSLVHVAISLNDGQQRLYLNGSIQAQSDERFSNSLSHWKNRDNLFLLGFHHDFAAWYGVLFQMEILSGGLSESDVLQRLSQGLPPSPPFVQNSTVILHEDAERNPESHPPEWYELDFSKTHSVLPQAQIQEFDQVPLPIQSIQNEVFSLLQALGMDYLGETSPVHVLVTRLPSVGVLYLDGHRVDLSPTEACNGSVLLETFSDKVVYIPPHNAHSETINGSVADLAPFASLDYCVSSSPILGHRECHSSTATVTILVQPTNDPPVPRHYDSPMVLREGFYASNPKILLTGTDVDKDDRIRRVRISRFPQYGNLTLNVGSFRGDGQLHGTQLSEQVIRGQQKVYVQYSWDPFQRFSGVLRNIAKDQFSYQVADKMGQWSLHSTVSLEIRSALQLEKYNQTIKLRKEDGIVAKNITISIVDSSGYPSRRMGLFFDTIPSPNRGSLVDPSTNETVTNETLVMGTKTGDRIELELIFLPNPDLCGNSGGQDQLQDYAIDFFTKAVAFEGGSNRMMSVSERVLQQIRIECLPSPIELSGDRSRRVVLQSNPQRSSLGLCNGVDFNPLVTDLSTCQDTLVIDRVKVHSKSPLSWPNKALKVQVTSGAGLLTFNAGNWNKTRPLQGRRLEASGSIVFLVFSRDLENVLSNLQYRSSLPGNDTIDILLYQGSCNLKQDETEFFHNTSSKCTVFRHSIPILVKRDPNLDRPKTALIAGFPWQILVCLIGYPMVYLLLVHLENISSDVMAQADDDSTIMESEQLEDVPEWIQYESANGDLYYENTVTGEITWMAPIGEPFVRWQETTDADQEEKTEVEIT